MSIATTHPSGTAEFGAVQAAADRRTGHERRRIGDRRHARRPWLLVLPLLLALGAAGLWYATSRPAESPAVGAASPIASSPAAPAATPRPAERSVITRPPEANRWLSFGPDATGWTGWHDAAGTGARSHLMRIGSFETDAGEFDLATAFGPFNRYPDDALQGARQEWSPENASPGPGRSARVLYDVDSPRPAMSGWWLKMRDADLSKYSTIVFHLKADPELGATSRLRVELKNREVNQQGVVTLEGLSKDWTRYRIPLSKFRGLRDLSRIQEFVLVFEDWQVTQRSGGVLVDEIYFER